MSIDYNRHDLLFEARHYAFVLVQTLTRAHELAENLPGKRGLLRDLGDDLSIAQVIADEIGVDLERVRNNRYDHLAFVRILDHVRALTLDLDGDRAVAGELPMGDEARLAARELRRVLELVAHGNVRRASVDAAGPVHSARRLAEVVVRVLPPSYRLRYREEFDSELYDLAAAGTSRRSQLMYSVRLVDRAWQLRAELDRRPPRKTSVAVKVTVTLAGTSGGTSVVVAAGWPVIVDLGILALAAGGLLCWVISSKARTARLAKLIAAVRGK